MLWGRGNLDDFSDFLATLVLGDLLFDRGDLAALGDLLLALGDLFAFFTMCSESHETGFLHGLGDFLDFLLYPWGILGP